MPWPWSDFLGQRVGMAPVQAVLGMSQKEIILGELKHHSLCVSDLPDHLSYTLRNRVSELRRDGVDIRSERCRVHRHRAAVVRYALVSKPVQETLAI